MLHPAAELPQRRGHRRLADRGSSPCSPPSPCCPRCSALIGMRVLSRRERRQLAADGPRPRRAAGLAARWSAFVQRRPGRWRMRRARGHAGAGDARAVAAPGPSDQGNDPPTTTTRQAYDLLAERLRPGLQRPAPARRQTPDGADQAALDRLADAVQTTPGRRVRSPRADRRRATASARSSVIPTTSPQDASRPRPDRPACATTSCPHAERGTTLKVHVGGLTAIFDDFADGADRQAAAVHRRDRRASASCCC